jgi:hypothetical protein
MRLLVVAVVAVLLLVSTGRCGAQDIDFVTLIQNSPDARQALGVDKLSEEERQAWNRLLNKAVAIGAERQVQNDVSRRAQPAPQASWPKPASPRVIALGSPAYITKVDDEDGDVLTLDNGAVVEITSGFLGFGSTWEEAILYKDGLQWRIWISGKEAFDCDVIKEPEFTIPNRGEVVQISRVLGEGRVVELLSGDMYEVDAWGQRESSLWLVYSDALLIDGSQLVNLEDGDEILDVTRIR